MREIKFRAWHKGVNKMLYDDDPIVTMQYTGVKDKNDVEIYEGDIVKYKDYSDYVYEVIFDEKECKFFAIGITKTQSENNLGYKINSNLEVIGNIYENRELLK